MEWRRESHSCSTRVPQMLGIQWLGSHNRNSIQNIILAQLSMLCECMANLTLTYAQLGSAHPWVVYIFHLGFFWMGTSLCSCCLWNGSLGLYLPKLLGRVGPADMTKLQTEFLTSEHKNSPAGSIQALSLFNILFFTAPNPIFWEAHKQDIETYSFLPGKGKCQITIH